MKKMIKIGLCAAAAAVVMTGCGKKASNTETTAAETTTAEAETKSQEELTDEASITIGNYDGLELTTKKTEVTEDDIAEQLETLRTQYPAEVTGRAAQEGDTCNIDYVGKKDGEAFTGGTASGYDLTLGSNTFISGFEDGVVGMEVGEVKDLDLTFPENYSSEELAGQDVVFTVTLNAIKSADGTEVDDALAQRVMGDDSATLEDLRELLKTQLENQAELSYFNGAGSELLSQVIANSEITCDPDAVDSMYNQLETTYSAYATQYGLDLSTFLSLFLGTDEDGLKASAENLVKQEMCLNEIIANEKIEATDEQKEKLAQMNYFNDAAEMISTYGEESADRLFEMGAAYYYLIDNAVEVDVPEETAAETSSGESILEEVEESVSEEETKAQ